MRELAQLRNLAQLELHNARSAGRDPQPIPVSAAEAREVAVQLRLRDDRHAAFMASPKLLGVSLKIV